MIAFHSRLSEKTVYYRFFAPYPELTERDVPDYIEVDHNKMTAKFVRTPGLGDVPFAVKMEPNLVVEFYSR